MPSPLVKCTGETLKIQSKQSESDSVAWLYIQRELWGLWFLLLGCICGLFVVVDGKTSARNFVLDQEGKQITKLKKLRTTHNKYIHEYVSPCESSSLKKWPFFTFEGRMVIHHNFVKEMGLLLVSLLHWLDLCPNITEIVFSALLVVF